MTQIFDQDEMLDSVLGEFYFADGDIILDGDESGDLVWKEILREGEWAYRPGPNQKPVNMPLRVVSGHSDNKEIIGMADLVDAFNDGALDHVTVPTSHKDSPTENTGFVKELKIVERDGKHYLAAGIQFTEPDVKEKALRGTIPNTSAGIMFEYIKKDTGKVFRQVLGHVALTGKPWLNGMKPFGPELSEDMEIISAEPVDESTPELFDDQFIDFLDLDATLVPNKPGVSNWIEKHGGLPKKIADMAGDLISEKGFSVGHAIATAKNRADVLCAKGDKEWCAAVAEWNRMRAAARADMAADKDFIEKLSGTDEGSPEDSADSGADEEHSQDEGGTYMAEVKTEDTTGGSPSTDSGDSAPVELSEDQREQLFAEWTEKQAEKDAKTASENAKLRSKVHAMEVDKRISELSKEGYAEYSGLLAEIRSIMLADDGKATLTLSEEVDGESKEVEVSVTGAIERLLSALPKKDGKVALSEQVLVTEDHGKPKNDDGVELSDDERAAAYAEDLGIVLPKDGDS